MRVARWHTYQVLTKRSRRLLQVLSGPLLEAALESHIWWGVSVEDRTHGLPRIADLQATPAAVRFLSIEPLLEDLGEISLDGISWVIVGGESGPGARPMKAEWVWSIKHQCDEARVPFFFKQWGGVHKKSSGRTLGGRVFDDTPMRSQNEVLSKTARLQLIADIEQNTSIL
jgi:protein gp37